MAIINGDERADMLRGTPGADVIEGKGGGDRVSRRAGADRLFGDGSDEAVGFTGDDDGRITAADAEVRREGADLVLDLDAVLTRAFGRGRYGTQEATVEGAGFDVDRIVVYDGGLPEAEMGFGPAARTAGFTA